MSQPRPSFDEVNSAARPAIPDLLARWLPGGKRQSGEWVARNPTRSDKRAGSFRINMRSGKWADFATDDRGGDVVSLYAYLHGVNQGEACDAIAEEIGLTIGEPGAVRARAFTSNPEAPAPPPDPWQPILPVPDDAPDVTPAMVGHFAPAGFRFAAMWDYLDETGRLLGHTVRFERPANGVKAGKEILPLTFCAGPDDRREWRLKALPEPRALYGLTRLANDPDAAVIVVEGEKKVDAAGDLFPELVPVTSPGGSKAWRKADWSALEGRRVVIWPDHDEAGRTYAVAVAEALQTVASAVYVVTIPEHFPPTWDLADDLPAGATHETLRDMLASARQQGGPAASAQGAKAQAAASGEWKTPRPLPSGLLPVAPFDADMVPAAIGPWVSDIADRMQCPPDFIGVSAMVGLAAVLGRKIAVKPQEKTDWQEVPNLWGCIVGRPGAMKSPAMNEALKPLNRLEADAREANKDELKRHTQAMMLHKIKVEVAQQGAKAAIKAGGIPVLDIEEPEPPEAKRFVTNDSTYEALGVILAANPNGVLVFRDELVSLLKTLDREEYAAARGFYLSAWNGTGGYTFDRIVRGLTHVDAVCVSMLGSTQPGRLADYLSRAVTGSAGDDGLIQRFGLLVWPDDSGMWKEVDRYPDSAAKEQAWAAFSRLRRLTAAEAGAEQGAFDHIPHLRFDRTARGLFSEWRADLEMRLKAGTLHSSIESHLAKYRKLVPALALINHLADGGHGPIGETALLKALAFSVYLETHAKRAYSSGTQTEVATANAILAKLRKGDLAGEFTVRDIMRRDWSNLNDKAQITAGLELLDDLDWIASRDLKTGGRPKTTYTANPRGLQ